MCELPGLQSDDGRISGFSVVSVVPHVRLTTAVEASALAHGTPLLVS